MEEHINLSSAAFTQELGMLSPSHKLSTALLFKELRHCIPKSNSYSESTLLLSIKVKKNTSSFHLQEHCYGQQHLVSEPFTMAFKPERILRAKIQ
jgi:hypothetical protein